MSFADSIRQTASIARWVSVAMATDHTIERASAQGRRSALLPDLRLDVRKPCDRFLDLPIEVRELLHAPDLDLQVDTGVATGEVAHSTGLAVVEGPMPPSTRPAGRFFPRRRSRTIRALGSPKMPRTVASGRKPGNRNASSSRRGFRIRVSCRISRLEEKEETPGIKGFGGNHRRFTTHSVGRRA